MVLKHVKQIFKSYVTKWLKWPVNTDHYPIFAALHLIKSSFGISRRKTKKHISRRIELNSCKKMICDLSLKISPSAKKNKIYKILSNRKDELNKKVC